MAPRHSAGEGFPEQRLCRHGLLITLLALEARKRLVLPGHRVAGDDDDRRRACRQARGGACRTARGRWMLGRCGVRDDDVRPAGERDGQRLGPSRLRPRPRIASLVPIGGFSAVTARVAASAMRGQREAVAGEVTENRCHGHDQSLVQPGRRPETVLTRLLIVEGSSGKNVRPGSSRLDATARSKRLVRRRAQLRPPLKASSRTGSAACACDRATGAAATGRA